MVSERRCQYVADYTLLTANYDNTPSLYPAYAYRDCQTPVNYDNTPSLYPLMLSTGKQRECRFHNTQRPSQNFTYIFSFPNRR